MFAFNVDYQLVIFHTCTLLYNLYLQKDLIQTVKKKCELNMSQIEIIIRITIRDGEQGGAEREQSEVGANYFSKWRRVGAERNLICSSHLYKVHDINHHTWCELV